MDVVALISQKGGSGKTTLAIALAVAAERAGQAAAIIDLDPQVSATKWADRRENAPPAVVSAQPARLPSVLAAAAANGARLVLIDTQPRAAADAGEAVRAARLVLVPCRPSVFDLDTIATTLTLIRLSGAPRVVAVLNGVPPSGQERAQATEVLRDLHVEVCPAVLGARKAFSHAAALGQSAQEFEPDGKAAHEVAAVYRFIRKLLNS